MSLEEQIVNYINSHSGQKRDDMRALHDAILQVMPKCKLWFLDGKNDAGKTVSNPNIGYGLQVLTYAGGRTREFYKIGLSANTAGISVYIMGIEDKKHLARTFGKSLGKASVTGYCIKFKKLDDIDLDVLKAAIRGGTSTT